MRIDSGDLARLLKEIHRTKSGNALWHWIKDQFGIKLPYKYFTEGHSTPFDFVADAFFNPNKDVAAWASRSGIKTLGASILAALEFTITDGLQGRVLAGSEDQAKNMYKYWKQWCGSVLSARLDGDVKKLLTPIGGGSFEILAASQKKVRGGKIQRLYEDELDEIDPEIDEAAIGMIDSRPGRPGRTIFTSTWHHMTGLMGKLVEECPGNGVSLHKWNLWESIAQCPESRHDKGKNCESCPLGVICLAKARESHLDPEWEIGIAAEACGLYSIEDVIKAFHRAGAATWDSEYLCKRPSIAGVVYPEFDPGTHVWKKDLPTNMTIYRAIDWGRNVFVCLWIGVDKLGNSLVLDTYRAEHGTLTEHAAFIKKHKYQNIEATYCDPAGTSTNDQTGVKNVEFFESEGIPCQWTYRKKLTNVENGIRIVKGLLRTATGDIRLKYVPNENNKMWAKAMSGYVNMKVNGIYVDKPKKPQPFEHIPDATRYYAINQTTGAPVTAVYVSI